MAELSGVHRATSTIAADSGNAYLIPAGSSWGAPAWELFVDLQVALERSGSAGLVVVCPSVREYGIGPTIEEAIEDLLTSLSDYCESLESRESRLAEAEANDLAELRRMMRRQAVP